MDFHLTKYFILFAKKMTFKKNNKIIFNKINLLHVFQCHYNILFCFILSKKYSYF